MYRRRHPSFHSFHPLGARWTRLKWRAEILCFANHLFSVEFHDAYNKCRLIIIGDDDFADPKTAATQQTSDREPFLIRLSHTRFLYPLTTADPFTRLRILEDRALLVDLVLGGEIVGVGRRPMPLQSGPQVVIAHISFLPAMAPAASSRLHAANAARNHWTFRVL